jgi:hypothetical protein
MTEQPSPPPSKRKLLIGSGIAVIAAAAIVTMFVLPAEYGIDPTGVGKATGVLKIAEPGPSLELQRGMKRTGVLTLSETPLPAEPDASDTFAITLAPFGAIEMKYEIAEGQPMVFHWQASAPVHVDMHAHPFEGGTALTESYVIDDAVQAQSGRYVAPFTGIHGWYWQNRTLKDVTVKIDASGKLIGSRTFDQFGEHPRALTGPAAATE